MKKLLFLTLFSAFFLIGGYNGTAMAHCGKCASKAETKKAVCEKCLKAGKPCKCAEKKNKKPCEKTLNKKKKPCEKTLAGQRKTTRGNPTGIFFNE